LAGLGLGKRAMPVLLDEDDARKRSGFGRAERSRNRQHWHMLRFGRR
jgi:hypothetical protein